MIDRMGAWPRRRVLAGMVGATAVLGAPAILRAAPSGKPVRVGGTLSLTGFLAQTAQIHKIAAEIMVAAPQLSIKVNAPREVHVGEVIDLTFLATFAPSGRDTAILAEQVGEEIAIKLNTGPQLELHQKPEATKKG